jgi:hypothetical protein
MCVKGPKIGGQIGVGYTCDAISKHLHLILDMTRIKRTTNIREEKKTPMFYKMLGILLITNNPNNMLPIIFANSNPTISITILHFHVVFLFVIINTIDIFSF